MLNRHTDAVEADLQVYCNGVDLGDYWRGELSLRRLSVLVRRVEQIPGSAVWCIRNDMPQGWTLTDLLLTDLYYALTNERHPLAPDLAKKAKQNKNAALIAQLKAQRARLAAQQQQPSTPAGGTPQ